MMPCALPNPPTTAVSSSNTDGNTVTLQNEKHWHKAVETLAKFAAMDTAQYTSMLVTNEQQRRRSQNTQSQNNERVNEQNNLMLQLENLRRDGAFEETPIPDLVRAIHRFHSNLALWHHQDSQHAREMRQLQDALAKSQSQEDKLAQECKKLKSQTNRLRTKLQEKRKVLAQARLWFKESTAERESLQEIATAAQLQVHEHLMTAPGRIRLGSTESNFSDVDALNYIEGEHSEGTDADYTNTSSIEENESQCSLVTDEGVATLHFKADEYLPRIAATSSSYTLEFPSGVKTGMRVKSVPVTEWMPLAKPALSPSHLDGSSSCAVSDADEEITDDSTDAAAFIVCGHHRFDSDDDSNSKALPRVALPPVGARILAVRDQQIGPTWVITDVLGAMSNTHDGKPTFKVTFRNGRTIKSKQQQKSLATTTSDEESSQDEDKKGEVRTEQPRNGRSFNLFGTNNGAKYKDSQVTAEQDSKPALQKGNGNPLMFWRHEEKTADGDGGKQQHDKIGDLSLEKKPHESSKDQCPVSESFPESEQVIEETTNKGNGNNPLKFWKKDNAEPRFRTISADSFFPRQRKNTADSAAFTEATMMSKEDGSVTSCSESKAEECHPGTFAEDGTGHKTIPMNHLMFWRKTESSQGTEEIPAALEEVSQEVGEAAQEEPAATEKSPLNEKSSERSSFSFPFWSPQARQTPTTDQAATVVSETTLSAEDVPSDPENQAKSLENSSSENIGVGEGEPAPAETQEGPAEEGRGSEDKSSISHSEEEIDSPTEQSQTPDTCAEAITEQIMPTKPTVEEVTPPTERAEETPADPTAETLDSGSTPSDQHQKQCPEDTFVKEHSGPMKQMGRFFSNPFANLMEG
eukprot:scaffold1771_cov172-Amphora_coffeaeformis.AAC.25